MKRKSKVLLSVLSATFALSPVVAYAAAFKDVPATHWAKATIDWGTSKKIVAGYPDGTFKPENRVIEAEFLVMLISSFQGKQEKTGTHWASGYYTFAQKMNYATFGGKLEEAKGWNITRQQVAEIVAGANGVNYTGKDAVKYLLAKGLARGKNPKEISVESFKPDDYLSRAEAIQLIRGAMEKGLTELKTRPTEPSPVTEDMKKIPDSTPKQPVVEQPASSGQVTVVPPSDSNFLLPKDTVTEPAVQAFLDSLKYENGKVTGVVPEIPKNHTMVLRYTDNSDGKWGERKNDKDFTNLKSGEKFSVEVMGQGGKLLFDIYKNPNIGVNGATVYVPSMKAEWEAKR
ncbi:S-layer homology domain-containing protein [Aneurinibacillus aneurinilyticus]|uniref:S-layer homology domain-containing protein n=1 Tax=Aneurinibacillus aneurinilyticus TaxID=1391 RepID=UPI0023F58F08|nr:S-layer homology domain-containing protein [Aneurinibacillus aneurinilyticus]